MRLLIKNGRIIDPQNNLDEISDLLIENGKIIRIENEIVEDCDTIDASSKIVVPGFVDIHVHLREPGYEYKETIASGTRAASKGGVTSLVCMPNTNPTISTPEVVKEILIKSADAGYANVFPSGTITDGIKGEKISEIEKLIQSGIVAVTDDGRTTMNKEIMIKAFEIIKKYDLVLMSHAEDHDIVHGGCINQGDVSEKLGLKGISNAAEFNIVKRDIELAEQTQSRLHIAHISTSEALEYVKSGKDRGVNVTCEIGPHHFVLDDSIIKDGFTEGKVNPPIRSLKDKENMLKGISEGYIDAIATDHAPHSFEDKDKDFYDAAFGISGIETSFSLSYTHLVKTNIITINRLVEMMSSNPAKIIRKDKGTLGIGKDADIAIIDLDKEYIIDSKKFYSKGKNTPFNGYKVNGVVEYTILGGKVVFRNDF